MEDKIGSGSCEQEIISTYPQVAQKYKRLTSTVKAINKEEDLLVIDKAFQFALVVHQEMKRKDGEPFIVHPLNVALIVANEMGLGTVCIAASLLHHVAEMPGVTLKILRKQFGKRIAGIVEGVTKIQQDFETPLSAQVANFKHLMEKSKHDHRIILIKIADRLDNMRSLEALSATKRMRVASETKAIFAPITHRLGMSEIKTEFEDLCLKHLQPGTYHRIHRQLLATAQERESILKAFSAPIEEALHKQKITFRIKKRLKSISSIWRKMEKQHICLNQIYDLIALRIIIDCPPEEESLLCWQAYALVTSFYKPHAGRLRDWITLPRSNGYESLHITVMSPMGRWVEVQIRTERMDRIASRGVAAHWKYKEDAPHEDNPQLEQWIESVHKLLKEDKHNSINTLSEVQTSFYKDEINVFTEKGACKVFPKGASVLDFVVATQGHKALFCTGALTSGKILSVHTSLSNGQQIKPIIQPYKVATLDWLNYVITPPARQLFKRFFNEQQRGFQQLGEETIRVLFEEVDLFYNPITIDYFQELLGAEHFHLLCRKIGDHTIISEELFQAAYAVRKMQNRIGKHKLLSTSEQVIPITPKKGGSWELASCCKPVPGEEVIGFLRLDGRVVVHQMSCEKGQKRLAEKGNTPVKLRWGYKQCFTVSLSITAVEKKQVIVTVLTLVEAHSTILKAFFNKEENALVGHLTLSVKKVEELNELISELQQQPDIVEVKRTSASRS